MTLTAKQEEGLKTAVSRYKAKERWTCIAGYAGTGKSTLVKFIIAALNLDPEDVAYITFTGKAASVLRHKGCPNAMTAHKLLYYSEKLSNGKFIFKPRKRLAYPYKLIVVDEISMLSNDLWMQLLKHNVHIIACGDPFQIPPIQKNADNHVLDTPHVFLDEIMRQAAESEIVRLSMDIRNFQPINYIKGKEIQVIPQREVVTGMYNWADQIITATNKKRQEINEAIRTLAGRGPDPESGDKVICGRNCWEITDWKEEMALVNGTIGYLIEPIKQDITIPLWNAPEQIPVLLSDMLTTEGEMFIGLGIDYTQITTGKKLLTPEQEYTIYKSDFRDMLPIEFDYGYAITGHRAQGSEWDKVLVFEENFPFDKIEHARWLYTTVTRAAQKLVLVR